MAGILMLIDCAKVPEIVKAALKLILIVQPKQLRGISCNHKKRREEPTQHVTPFETINC